MRNLGDTSLPRARRTGEHAGEDAPPALGYGRHACLLHDTERERVAALASFLDNGLRRGDRCVYIGDGGAPDAILQALAARGVDGERERQRGALLILSKHDTYLRQGVFDAQVIVDGLATFVKEALAAGFSGVSASGEMTWALGGTSDERLLEYESSLNNVFSGLALTAVCQYARRRFPPDVLAGIIQLHPVVMAGGHVHTDNPFYEPPDVYRQRGAGASRVNWMLDTLSARTRQRPAQQRLVLVIEGNRELRESLELVLVHAGYAVAAAADESEAVSRLVDTGAMPHLVLMGNPVVSGSCGFWSAHDGGALVSVPVVLLGDSPDVRGHALAVGAVDAICKPPELDELLAVVARHIGRRRR